VGAPARASGAPKKPSVATRKTPGRRAGPTPPRRFKAGRKLQAPRAILITSFRAEGSIGRQLAEQIYGGFKQREGGRYERKAKRFAELQSNAPDLHPQSPGIWTSNQGLVLGQVNFNGRVDVETLFAMLNRALNLNIRLVPKKVRTKRKTKSGRPVYETVYEEKKYRNANDFRDVYKTWKWKWQVTEVLVVPQNRQAKFKADNDGKVRRIIARKSGNSRSG
jgi:hypothetical protein